MRASGPHHTAPFFDALNTADGLRLDGAWLAQAGLPLPGLALCFLRPHPRYPGAAGGVPAKPPCGRAGATMAAFATPFTETRP